VRYLLLICNDEKAMLGMSPEDGAKMLQAWGSYTQDLKSSGKYVSGERLRPTSSATTVRQSNGKVLLSDGPFAETKEQLGGFFILEAANLDEAVEWAARMPHVAQGGSTEVRPIWDM
jgi:hypothetical protein